MSESVLRSRLTLAAVLGAGVVIGASGLYLHYRTHKCLRRELSNLTTTIESLRKDIAELKTTTPARSAPGSRAGSIRRKIRPVASADHPNNISVHEDDDLDEYYDVEEEYGDVGSIVSDISVMVSNGITSETKVLTSTGITICDPELVDLLTKVDPLLEGEFRRPDEAFDLLDEHREKYAENSEFLWRYARALYLISSIEGGKGNADRKKELILEAKQYATTALEIDSNNPDVRKWYAVALGAATDYLGIHDRIKDGHEFREHVDYAIKLKPTDHILYHMLGRWCYEVAQLSWIERKVASTLFAEPPYSTCAEARRYFLEAKDLGPKDWKENELYLAKCYIGQSDYTAAINTLDTAASTPATSKDEEAALIEIKSLQNKYCGYRSS